MSALPAPELRADELFAERYRIRGVLGEGGMGKVYEALDTRLDEVVALKLLSLRSDTPEHVERFHREVRLARRITHPNVARTHDIGQSGGSYFLTMERIAGRSLDAVLDERLQLAAPRQGPLSAAEAIALAVPIARGLQAAHDAGVVHRDLKPANVLVEMIDETTFGRVVITDFGVALAVDGGPAITGENLGTPLYMAPEQVLGETVGPAADIYGLGVILFEMLTGHLPFTGDTPMAVALARCRIPPADPRDFVDLSPPLRETVLRCLELSPERRPASAAAVAEALSRYASAVSAQTVMVKVAHSTTTPSRISNPFAPMALGQRTLAVLPFQYRGAPDLDYLGASLAQELIDTLSRTRGLRVLGFGATSRYGGDATGDPREVGRELNADVIVTADVQASPDRVRVAARITDVASGVQLWSDRFERRFEDVFEMQDVVSKQVANALRVELLTIEHQRHATPESIDRYLRGRKLLGARQLRGAADAYELFDRSMTDSPGFAPAIAFRALAALSAWWTEIMIQGNTLWRDRSELAVAAALEHADGLAETHLAAGMYALQIGELRKTATELATALAIAPTLAEAHRYLADLQVEAGRLEEGVRRARLALELDPSLVTPRFCIARYHALKGRWDACNQELDTIADGFGEQQTPLIISRVRFALWAGRLDLLRDQIGRLATSDEPVQQFTGGFARYVLGDADDPSVLEGALAFSEGFGNIRLTSLVGQLVTEGFAARGELRRAIEMLEKIADGPLVDVAWLERCPLLEALRATPEADRALTRVRNRATEIWEIAGR